MPSSAGETAEPFEDGASGNGHGIRRRSGHTTTSNDSNRSVLLSVEEILGLSQVHGNEDDEDNATNSRASTLTRTPSPLSFSYRSESSAVAAAAPPPPSQLRAQTWHATGNLWENYPSRTASAAYGRFRDGYDPNGNGNCHGTAAVEVSDANHPSRYHDDGDEDDYEDSGDLADDDDDDGSMTTFPESPPRPCQFVRLPPPQRFEIPRLPPRFEKRVPSRTRSGPGTLSRTTTTTADVPSRQRRIKSLTPPHRAMVETSFAPVEASRTPAANGRNARPAVIPSTTTCTTKPSIPAVAKKPTSRFEIFEDKLREHQGTNGILY